MLTALPSLGAFGGLSQQCRGSVALTSVSPFSL